MILTLPRKIGYLRGNEKIPRDMPLYRISRTRYGAAFYNDSDKIVAQIIKGRGRVRISIADGGSVELSYDGENIMFKAIETGADEPKPDESKARPLKGELIFFGNLQTAHYDVFIKREGRVKPDLIMHAVAHPLKEKLVNIEVSEGENVLLAASVSLALGFFQ